MIENDSRSISEIAKRIREEWEKKNREAIAFEKENKKKLEEAIKQEAGVQLRLEEAQKIAVKMESEFTEISNRVEDEKRKEIETNNLTEKDVREGRVSIQEFFAKGKTQGQKTKMTIEGLIKETDQILRAIRNKHIEILGIKKELYETRITILNLSRQPGQILKEALKKVSEYADYQLALILQELPAARVNLTQTVDKLNLTKGKALSPGYRWDRLNYEQAKSVLFDPIFPENLIIELLARLKEYEGTDQLFSIIYYLGRGETPGYFDIQTIPGNLPKMGD